MGSRSEDEVKCRNPYAYLDRTDFSSEKYKIEVRGLPKHYGFGEFRKLLNDKLELQSSKVKPPKKGSEWLYVCFRSAECRDKAISVINGLSWKGSKLTAQMAKPAPDPLIKRKIEDEDRNYKKRKDGEGYEAIPPMQRVKQSTTPFWNVSYPEQLKLKQKKMEGVLKTLGQEILKGNANLADWLASRREKYSGLPCELLPILSASEIEGYRNKCEFTIGKAEKDDQTIIGFRLSSYAAGSTAVGPIDDLCHIPENMKRAAKIFEEFVRNSKFTVFDPIHNSGYWKQLTVRTSKLGHLMLIIGIDRQDLSEGDVIELKKSILEFFEKGKGAEANVTSLYFQTIERKGIGGEGGGSLEHLSGMKYIEESLMDMTFRVSPDAFFQINTLGAEVLYKAAIDLASPDTNTAILDVCCGTGTIGLCFSKYCGEVLGMETVSSAVEDAKENAKKNGVKNCEFFVGKAEDLLTTVVQRTSMPDIIAVVDPPRAGLHQRAILSLRKTKQLKKLVYVSCGPEAAIKNFVDFARPASKHYVGEPLVPVKAVAVDMFPHTKHCELVVYLERLSSV
ncbi:tRNA (uracil-5-)-methyltransferase homolog A [Orussus abietinus]|uniref:tRNA (uracil-5-)-methyltransferase homolog A n=1 Tax=Orussus abietinus TaxID=222816 RepID=UPI000C716210|nr:tRNA (uracil-5-)-methyltransferase homolog A [Orussus abietinus]